MTLFVNKIPRDKKGNIIIDKDNDKRHPQLTKVGCYFETKEERGFHFFNRGTILKDNDTFIYNKGILWRI